MSLFGAFKPGQSSKSASVVSVARRLQQKKEIASTATTGVGSIVDSQTSTDYGSPYAEMPATRTQTNYGCFPTGVRLLLLSLSSHCILIFTLRPKFRSNSQSSSLHIIEKPLLFSLKNVCLNKLVTTAGIPREQANRSVFRFGLFRDRFPQPFIKLLLFDRRVSLHSIEESQSWMPLEALNSFSLKDQTTLLPHSKEMDKVSF
ncbi:hypothetical protein BDD12DRAFT_808002 [Trichophaea hybrida]|nr:hypothetical protein BDD12DRAFT_808002 [Trichophaea hybrida]